LIHEPHKDHFSAWEGWEPEELAPEFMRVSCKSYCEADISGLEYYVELFDTVALSEFYPL